MAEIEIIDATKTMSLWISDGHLNFIDENGNKHVCENRQEIVIVSPEMDAEGNPIYKQT